MDWFLYDNGLRLERVKGLIRLLSLRLLPLMFSFAQVIEHNTGLH